jgi:LysR family carnitine catabolism transcriptional activator
MTRDTTYRHPWLGVEVRHLATLTAVARTRSFRDAARELGFVQSAVSQRIARMEQVVGAQLVERRRGQRNSVYLTPFGEVLAERGERILSELHAACSELSIANGAAGGIIRLALASDAAPVLGELLGAMRVAAPSTRIHVIEPADDRQLVPQLASGDADVAIGVPLAAPGVGSVVLMHDPFVLVAPDESRVARMASVSNPAELDDERLIVPASVRSHGFPHAPGLRLESALQVPLAAVVPGLVAQGHGIGLVPRSNADQIPPDLVTVPTAGLIAPQRLMLGWHAGRRRTAQVETFCDVAIRAFLDTDGVEHPRSDVVHRPRAA